MEWESRELSPAPPPQKAQSPYAGAKEGQKGYAYGASKKKKEVPEGMRRGPPAGSAKYYITGVAALLMAFSPPPNTPTCRFLWEAALWD